MNIAPLGAGFGAEITDVDLATLTDAGADTATLRVALLERGLLMVRSQQLSAPPHCSVLWRFFRPRPARCPACRRSFA